MPKYRFRQSPDGAVLEVEADNADQALERLDDVHHPTMIDALFADDQGNCYLLDDGDVVLPCEVS